MKPVLATTQLRRRHESHSHSFRGNISVSPGLVYAAAAFLALVSVAQAQNAYVRIDTPAGTSSGCYVWVPTAKMKKPLIVSTAHALKGKGEKVTVTVSRTKQVPGVVVAYDRELDLALVETEFWVRGALIPLDEAPEEGDAVLVGYGKGAFHEKRGKINGISPVRFDGVLREDLIEMEVPGRPGDSGGPVVYKGKLAGIHKGSIAGTNVCYFIPCHSVRVLILEYAGDR